MSASVYWSLEPAKHCVKAGEALAHSCLASALEAAFHHGPPWVFAIGGQTLGTLRAMAVAYPHEPNPYQEIHDALEKHERITVSYDC